MGIVNPESRQRDKKLNARKTHLLYILGHPYCGSTLFSIALGNSINLVNLGEVSFLENDYGEQVRCLCGKCLAECPFWKKVKKVLDEEQIDQPDECRFQLNSNGVLSGPDKRHKPITTRLKLILGVNKAFPEGELENYTQKNEVFFNAVSKATDGKIIIDVAKSPHRLLLLSQRTDVALKVIWLKRNMKRLFNSKIKRVKRRSRFYNPFFSSIIYIGWLLNYYWACHKVYKKILGEQKRTVLYETFIQNPVAVQNALSEFLDTDVDFSINAHNTMTILDQHIYVGNRWLFKNNGVTEVQIRTTDSPVKTATIEESVFWIFSLAFPVLRR